MGEDAAHVRVQLPLSAADRRRIIVHLEKLPVSIRGDRVDTLVIWVETALTVSFEGRFEHFGTLPSAESGLINAIAQLVEAASTIALSVPPEDLKALEDWKRQQPWHEELDLLAVASYRLGLGSTEDEYEDSKRVLSAAVRLLMGLPEIQEVSVEETPTLKDVPSAWLVRAVMYYRHKQKLKNTNTWNRSESATPGSHRKDRDMSPGSEAAKLVEATARVFGLDTPNRTLNNEMSKYKKFYEERGGGIPEYDDFAHPFRYFKVRT